MEMNQYEQLQNASKASVEAGLSFMYGMAERMQASLERQTLTNLELLSAQLDGLRALSDVSDAAGVSAWSETTFRAGAERFNAVFKAQLEESQKLQRETSAAWRSHVAEVANHALQLMERASEDTPSARPMIDSLRAMMAAGVEACEQVDSLIATLPGAGVSLSAKPATARSSTRRKAA